MSQEIQPTQNANHGPTDLWVVTGVLDGVQRCNFGIDFAINHELEVNAGIQLIKNYDAEQLGPEIAVSTMRMLSSYINKRFSTRQALVSARNLGHQETVVAQDSLVWDDVYTLALGTRAGAAEELVRSMVMYSDSHDECSDRRRDGWVDAGSIAWLELQQEVIILEKDAA